MALNPYQGQLSYGLRNGVGGENATWGIDPNTGREVPVVKGANGNFLLSDLFQQYGSWNNIGQQMDVGSGANTTAGFDNPLYRTDLWNARPSNDTNWSEDGSKWAAMYGAAVGAGALTGGAAGGGSALAGGGEVGSGYAASGSALGGTSGGPGMWDWLDQISGDTPYTFPGETASSGPAGVAGGGTGAFDMGGSQGVFDSSGNPLYHSPTSLSSLLSQYGSQGLSGLKGLLSGGSAGAGSTTGSQGGGILDSLMRNPLEAAFDSAPFLLAMNEANRQSGDLNGVIDKINGQGYTQAVLNPYDMDTGMGKTNLLQDLSMRGVSGSSFGNQQLGNYDYMRALGRGDLASKAQMSSAGLEGSLINQRNTNRNLLLGAGLNASAKLFSPQPDPFNLRALLGG